MAKIRRQARWNPHYCFTPVPSQEDFVIYKMCGRIVLRYKPSDVWIAYIMANDAIEKMINSK